MAGPSSKSYYVQISDKEVYLDAKTICGGKLSKLVEVLLREWLDQQDPTGDMREKIRKNRLDLGSNVPRGPAQD